MAAETGLINTGSADAGDQVRGSPRREDGNGPAKLSWWPFTPSTGQSVSRMATLSMDFRMYAACWYVAIATLTSGLQDSDDVLAIS